MIKRIYAAKLLGISDDNVRRLEAAEYERALIEIRRIADEYGIEFDQVLREAQEAGERILSGGLKAELRRLAQELGISEEEARVQYEAVQEEYAL